MGASFLALAAWRRGCLSGFGDKRMKDVRYRLSAGGFGGFWASGWPSLASGTWLTFLPTLCTTA